MSAFTALNRLYPHRLLLPKEGIESVGSLFESLNIEVPKDGESQGIVAITRDEKGFSQGNNFISILIAMAIKTKTFPY